MTVVESPVDIDVRPLTAVIGAEIHGVDLREDLGTETVAAIRAALLRWRVVFFREQDIDFHQQLAFGRRFGRITPGHPLGQRVAGSPELHPVTATQQRDSVKRRDEAPEDQGDKARRWHTDITPVINPAAISILRGVVVPPVGGDTLWTNLVAAYEGLSEPIRRFIDTLQAVHTFGRGTRRSPALLDGRPRYSSIHPVVRVHPETGEKGLFVSPNFTSHIVGVTPRESEPILELLYAQLARHEFTVRFRWAPGSIAMWDNRATAHLAAADIDHADYERYLERITIAGDIPVGPDGFVSQSIEGERFE